MRDVGDHVAFVRVGTLDPPDRPAPDVHIFTETRQPWFALPVDTPSFPVFYRYREVWSEASIARRLALRSPAGDGSTA